MARVLRAAASALAFALGVPAAAQSDGKQWLTLTDGESRELYGATYTARGPVQAVAILSSEMATVAVVEGILASGKQRAGPGEALVTPVVGKTQRFAYDAARLKPTLRPEWLATAAAPLDAIAAQQKRAKFWGRLEPAGVNAAAPISPAVESVRQSYLANATITDLRRRAGGNMERLAPLTAQAFTTAIAQGDTRAVAALIDPKPFTDTGAGAESWQPARDAFATRLTGDGALKAAFGSGESAVDPANAAAYIAGGYRITLIKRDSALFVASVEPAL